MTPESLPSGVLKVAPLQGLSSWLNHMAYKFPEDGPTLSAWAKEVEALASPPPQATGALSEPVAWMTHHDEPMLFPTWREAALHCDDDEEPIPLYTAASQVEPENKQ